MRRGAPRPVGAALDGLTAASRQPAERLCRACFDGSYPIPIPQRDLAGKHVLEGSVRRSTRVPGSQLGGHGADHEHVASGQVVVHNGLATVDRMDAVLGEELAVDAMVRP